MAFARRPEGAPAALGWRSTAGGLKQFGAVDRTRGDLSWIVRDGIIVRLDIGALAGGLGIFRLAIWCRGEGLTPGTGAPLGYPRYRPGLLPVPGYFCSLPFVCWANVSAGRLAATSVGR
jgi:hypothetical protein